jgi:hypothetical protein
VKGELIMEWGLNVKLAVTNSKTTGNRCGIKGSCLHRKMGTYGIASTHFDASG